jgi:hypothetical protein
VTNPASTKRRAFNVREFCSAYGLGHDGVYKAIREGKLVARKYGKRTIITADDADRFIAALPRLELVQSKQQIVAAELVRRLQLVSGHGGDAS